MWSGWVGWGMFCFIFFLQLSLSLSFPLSFFFLCITKKIIHFLYLYWIGHLFLISTERGRNQFEIGEEWMGDVMAERSQPLVQHGENISITFNPLFIHPPSAPPPLHGREPWWENLSDRGIPGCIRPIFHAGASQKRIFQKNVCAWRKNAVRRINKDPEKESIHVKRGGMDPKSEVIDVNTSKIYISL